MYSPTKITDHKALILRPELEAKQAIIPINDKWGLSIIWAKGGRAAHGFYCEDGQVEAILIIFDGEGNFNISDIEGKPFKWLDTQSTIKPHGWLSEDDIQALCENVSTEGLEGYLNFKRSPFN